MKNDEYPDDYTSPDQELALEEAIRHSMEEREEAAIARSQALLADFLDNDMHPSRASLNP